MTSALASSDLCVNSGEASVDDCFWTNDVSLGISVSPKQLVYLNPFISFPQAPGLIPFSVASRDAPDTSSGDIIYTLIETDLVPLFNQQVPLEVIVTLRVSRLCLSLCVYRYDVRQACKQHFFLERLANL